jgi:hypothetical protein
VEERLESDWCLDGWLCVPLCVSPSKFLSLLIKLINELVIGYFPRLILLLPRIILLAIIYSNHPSISLHQIPTRRRTNPSTTPTQELNSTASEHARHSKPNGRPLRPRRLYPPISLTSPTPPIHIHTHTPHTRYSQ